MNTKTSLIVIIVLLLAAAVFAYLYYTGTIKLAEAKIEKDRQYQNAEAYKDSMEMKARELQDNATFVYNLQTENSKIKKEVAYFKSKFTLMLDSVKVLNQGTSSHNYGDSIIVFFEGKQGRVSYKGQTIYFTVLDTGTYSINIWQDPIKIESYVYLNEEDNLIYNRIYADSVLIDDAYTVVDSALYKKLKMPTTVKLGGDWSFWNSISLYGEYKFAFDPSSSENKSNIDLGLDYRFENGLGLKVGKTLTNGFWFVGVKYSLTPGSIFSIF